MKKPVVASYGLIYPSVDTLLSLNGIKSDRRAKPFQKIQLIEMGALEGFAERGG